MIILTALSINTLENSSCRLQKGGTKAPANLISKTGPMKLLFFTLIGVIVLNSKHLQNPTTHAPINTLGGDKFTYC